MPFSQLFLSKVQSYPFFSQGDQVVRSQAKWKLHFRVFHILCVISPAPHTNIPPTWHFAQIWKHFQVVSQPKVVNFLWIIFRTPPVYWKFDMLPGSSRSSPYFLSSYQYHPPLRPILEPRFTQGHSATITPPGQDRSQSQIMLSFSFAIFTILPPTPKSSFCLHVQLWSLPRAGQRLEMIMCATGWRLFGGVFPPNYFVVTLS